MNEHAANTNTGTMKQALKRYNLVLRLLALPAFLYTAWYTFVFRDGRYLAQRFGFRYPRLSAKPIWIHAASVGEVSAVLPLIQLLLDRQKNAPILITTFTPTGGQFVLKNLSGKVCHIYLPVDFSGAVKRFLNAVDPVCAIIMETELWPNLFSQCDERKIPLIIINGRISPRTLNAKPWLRNVYAAILKKPVAILARSEQDKSGFLKLGAPAEKVRVTGNIKFAFQEKATSPPVSDKLLERPYVLIASTHEDEEKRILKVWLSIQSRNYLLVIAPRHPKRLADILSQISGLTDQVAVRSRRDEINEHTRVYLVDTLGELTGFMANAEFIFMGGSLVKTGGHNIIEPASFGKAIVFGPHMENFSEEAALFLEHDAALQIKDEDGLADIFRHLLVSPEQCESLGENAKKLVAMQQDIAVRYLEELEPYIK